VKPSVKNWTFVENPSVKLRCLELAFEKHAEKLVLKRENPTGFRTSSLKKKSAAVQRSVIVGKMDRGTVKFLMLFKGSLLPPLTDLLSRIEGSGPQENASF
jgi:hypothetical protein